MSKKYKINNTIFLKSLILCGILSCSIASLFLPPKNTAEKDKFLQYFFINYENDLFTHFKAHIISYKVNNSLKDDILYDREAIWL